MHGVVNHARGADRSARAWGLPAAMEQARQIALYRRAFRRQRSHFRKQYRRTVSQATHAAKALTAAAAAAADAPALTTEAAAQEGGVMAAGAAAAGVTTGQPPSRSVGAMTTECARAPRKRRRTRKQDGT
jgi:hypothetical protein